MIDCKNCTHQVVCGFKKKLEEAKKYINNFIDHEIKDLESPINLSATCTQFTRKDVNGIL